MTETQANAMQRAVQLALSGKYAEYLGIGEQLIAEGYQRADLNWTATQRNWLNQLCAEAQNAPVH